MQCGGHCGSNLPGLGLRSLNTGNTNGNALETRAGMVCLEVAHVGSAQPPRGESIDLWGVSPSPVVGMVCLELASVPLQTDGACRRSGGQVARRGMTPLPPMATGGGSRGERGDGAIIGAPPKAIAIQNRCLALAARSAALKVSPQQPPFKGVGGKAATLGASVLATSVCKQRIFSSQSSRCSAESAPNTTASTLSELEILIGYNTVGKAQSCPELCGYAVHRCCLVASEHLPQNSPNRASYCLMAQRAPCTL